MVALQEKKLEHEFDQLKKRRTYNLHFMSEIFENVDNKITSTNLMRMNSTIKMKLNGIKNDL